MARILEIKNNHDSYNFLKSLKVGKREKVILNDNSWRNLYYFTRKNQSAVIITIDRELCEYDVELLHSNIEPPQYAARKTYRRKAHNKPREQNKPKKSWLLPPSKLTCDKSLEIQELSEKGKYTEEDYIKAIDAVFSFGKFVKKLAINDTF